MIVISGISGRFPESNSIAEFRENLFSGVDMVNDDPRRWPSSKWHDIHFSLYSMKYRFLYNILFFENELNPGLYGLPTRIGKIKNLEYFDAIYFGIPTDQVEVMDPQLRLLLESTY